MFQPGVGGAVRHLDLDTDKVSFDFRHELEGHDAHARHAGGQEEQAEEEDNRRIAIADRHFQGRLVEIVGKPEQAVSDRVLQFEQLAGWAFEGLALHVRQVARQDQHAFNDREDQGRDHDEGDLLGEHPGRPGNEGPGQESDDRGENPENHRLENQLCPDDRSVQAFASPTLDFPVDILPDYDGVIDDHANHEQHGEGRENVPGHAKIGEEQDAAREGGDDAHRHPQGNRRTQEQDQDEHDQDGPGQGRLLDQVHTCVERFGIVIQDVDPHGLRENAVGWIVGALDVFLDAVRIFDNVHRVWLGHLHEHSGLIIVGGLELVGGEAVINGRHIGHADRALFR